METLFTILRICEVLACLVAFFSRRKMKNTYWRYFPLYLAFIVAAEYIGHVLALQKMYKANFVFYSYLVIPVEFLFFFDIFRQALGKDKYKWLPVASIVCYFICLLLDMIYFNKRQYFYYSFSYTIGNLLLLLLVLRYFIKLVTSNDILEFKNDMMFWVCTGLLLYYLGTFPYYGLRNTIVYKYPALNLYYSYIVYLLDSFMYLMFTFSFIWGRPNIKSS